MNPFKPITEYLNLKRSFTYLKNLTFSVIFSFLFLLLFLPSPVLAQKTQDTAIKFIAETTEFHFYAPMRSGYASLHPLRKEVPRINLMVNLINNYLNYLIKLNKLELKRPLKIVYAPELTPSQEDMALDHVKIYDLGLNGLLQAVNRHLQKHEKVDLSALIETVDALSLIQDVSPPKKLAESLARMELKNLSLCRTSLEPEKDFCHIAENNFITVRPDKLTDKIFLLSKTSDITSGEILLGNADSDYANLQLSANKRYLAFTDALKPKVYDLEKYVPQDIFASKSNKILLQYAWSPTEPLLIGMTLDTKTEARSVFVYNAETQKLSDANFAKLPEAALYAWPLISPQGSYAAFTSANAVHLIDLKKMRVLPFLISVRNTIVEFIWSEDETSFAFVEVEGQSRDRHLFDDFDFRGSVIRAYRLDPATFSVVEDRAQTIQSRNTLRLIAFNHENRFLYLDGHLSIFSYAANITDLTTFFSAYLSPHPISSQVTSSASISEIESQKLDLKYLYVFKNLLRQDANIYDAGLNGKNQLYQDKYQNLWILGLDLPETIKQATRTFSTRFFPYPYQGANQVYFSGEPKESAAAFLNFLNFYKIKKFDITNDCQSLNMLADFNGQLSLWTGEIKKITGGKLF